MLKTKIPREARLNPNFNEKALPIILNDGSEKELKEICQKLIDENNEFYAKIDLLSVIDRLNHIEGEIRKSVINRSEIAKQSIRALMTGEHQFIFSAPGVAKSLFTNQLFAYFGGAGVFSIQLCPDTSPDDLFGGYDIERFKKGEIYHNVEGSIITNHFAFLDEFMDGNDKLLRSLLGVLLERKFISGHQTEKAVLHTAIATANYMRQTETTEALLDRFLYKSYINPMKDMFTLLKIDQVYNENEGRVIKPVKNAVIDLREITFIKRLLKKEVEAKQITIPIEVDFLKNLIAVAFEQEMKKYRDKFYLSPRTITKSNDLLKANALLDGRMTVNEKDVEKLYYLFCTLNEPLDEDKTLYSQHLFEVTAQKRKQYFESIKNEITPLIYIVEFLHKAEVNTELLKDPITFIEDSAKHSIFKDLFDRLVLAFGANENIDFDPKANKKKLLNFIENIHSNYSEVNQFKDKTAAFVSEVFERIKL
ncbi:MoxR family ATPase [bacterium]|nr:MoxR family ATPase [bacterium]